MACLRTPSTSSTPNAFEPTRWSSLKYHGVHSKRAGDATPVCTSVRAVGQHAQAHLERLGVPDGVVHGVDVAGVHERQPFPRLADDAAGPLGQLVDQAVARLGREDLCAESSRPMPPGRASERSIATSTEGNSARRIAIDVVPSAPAPYTTTRPPCRRRVACDRVQRHRERISEHGDLVGDVVGHREHHGAMGREVLGETARRVLRVAGVDTRRQPAVDEAPTCAEVAVLAFRAHRVDAHGARTRATGSTRHAGRLARSSTAEPTSTTSATTSWPITCGNEMSAVIGLSPASSKSMRICFESEPQIPVSRVFNTTQSSATRVGSGTSSTFIGVDARCCTNRGASAGGVSTGPGSVRKTSALTTGHRLHPWRPRRPGTCRCRRS